MNGRGRRMSWHRNLSSSAVPLLLCLFLLASLAGLAHALTTISSCGIYTTSNEAYVLSSDLTGNQSVTAPEYSANYRPCLKFNASNITVNCAGHSLTGTTRTNSMGIAVSGVNISVFNCTISNYSADLSAYRMNYSICQLACTHLKQHGHTKAGMSLNRRYI